MAAHSDVSHNEKQSMPNYAEKLLRISHLHPNDFTFDFQSFFTDTAIWILNQNSREVRKRYFNTKKIPNL